MRKAVINEITAGGGPFIGLSSFDLGPLGYEQAEYALSGVASAYGRARDGLSVVDEASYTTRMLLYRPTDPAAFNVHSLGRVVERDCRLRHTGGLDLHAL